MEGLTTIPKKAVRPVETPEYVAWYLCKKESFCALCETRKSIRCHYYHTHRKAL